MIYDAGVWPAMVTPMTDSGRLNHTAARKLVDVYCDQQLGGLYILGSTGQGLLLSTEERQEFAATVVDAAAGRLPVFVHVGAMTTSEAVRLALHAERIGADAISAVGPVYYDLPMRAVFGHYRQISEACSLPLYIYQIDLVKKSLLDVCDYVGELLEIPTIAGMKITTGDLNQFGLIHGYAGDRLRLFSGHDEVFCHAALSGAVGAIGTFFGVFGPECSQVRRAFLGGDASLAARFMIEFQKMVRIALFRGGYRFVAEAIRQRYEIDVGVCRYPVGFVGEREDEGPWLELVADWLERLPRLSTRRD